MQKTSAGVDGDFATWRARSERGSILPGQKESMDLCGVFGGNPVLPLPVCLAHPAGTEPDCGGCESAGHRGEPPLAEPGQKG